MSETIDSNRVLGPTQYYRKRPIVVKACRALESIVIETLEGAMTAKPGDWIVTGTHGEHYPVKPEIFAETYEKVEGP